MKPLTVVPALLPEAAQWGGFTYLTCSVLPVVRACNCRCSFCFSASSLSDLDRKRVELRDESLCAYYRFARERGATRLVVTGGGEPLLRPETCLRWVELGSTFFDEIALFTNGARLTRELATRLGEAGLSYICYSRHHHDDALNRNLMGTDAPALDSFFAAAAHLRVRGVCVMCQGYIEDRKSAQAYLDVLGGHGVSEFTFKHTYVAYDRSLFRGSPQNTWANEHTIQSDPFEGEGDVLARLPWGPTIRRIGKYQLCHYTEPTPHWEREHRIGRSLNLMADGTVYGSLEDTRSRLFRLSS